MEKFYLGISLGFNSSACVFSSKRGLVAAVSQERLNGEKNTKEIPFDAMLKCIELAGTTTIERIAISHYENITESYFIRYSKHDLMGSRWQTYVLSFLMNNGITVNNIDIMRVDHHEAHALSTFGFYGIPVRDYYTITSDGFGDGLSGTIKYGTQTISTIKLENSIALVYQFVTGALGFKEHQHEGKITGLAAFGTPIYFEEFNSLYMPSLDGNRLQFIDDVEISQEEITNHNIIDFDKFLKLKKKVYALVEKLTAAGAKREDIAASVQEFAEVHTCNWIALNCTNKGASAYLAGGLFANVKINQRIKDLGIFKEVYVCPAMGDEGTAVGAVVKLFTETDDSVLEDLPACVHVLSGTPTAYAEDVLEKYGDLLKGYKVSVIDNNDWYIAEKLAENKIVCLMRDKMEFGPRALCHTSILYNCDSKETNKWLNDKLSRTEFMPFAPVCRKEVADDLFLNLDGGRESAKFMTMTFDCTDEFIQNYPAACHIDNTARPQIISLTDDWFMWSVLNRYQQLTGKKAMINTSFNLHNNPIIASEKVAIESWIKSDTDVLVIENLVIEKR